MKNSRIPKGGELKMPEPVTGAPAPEQQVVEQPVMEPVAAPEAQVQQPAQPAQTFEPLPDNVRDRTRDQYQKLIEANRRLQEQNMQYQQQLASRPVSQTTQQRAADQGVDPRDFTRTDADGTRYIDEEKLKKRLSELEQANQKVTQLQQQIDGLRQTSQAAEVERQERETYAAYPELNPSSKQFDKGFNQYVRSILTDSFYNTDEYGGRPFSFKEAADYVRAQFPKPKQAEPVTPAQQAAQQAQQAKQQAAAQQPQNQPRGNANQQMSDDEVHAELVRRTRYLNDDNALAYRILQTDHMRKAAEDE